MLLGLGQVIGHQVRLAHVLVGAAMARVDLQRTLVVHEGGLELAALAVGVAQVVLDVGVARIAERGGGKQPDRGAPVFRRDGRFPRRVIRIELSFLRCLLGRLGEDYARREGETQAEQADSDLEADHTVTGWPDAALLREAPADRRRRTARAWRASRSSR